MLAQICRDAVSRCPICTARQSRRGLDIAPLPNFDEVTGPNGGYAAIWVIDAKGPIKSGKISVIYYVLPMSLRE
jgi:hypothetical protein